MWGGEPGKATHPVFLVAGNSDAVASLQSSCALNKQHRRRISPRYQTRSFAPFLSTPSTFFSSFPSIFIHSFLAPPCPSNPISKPNPQHQPPHTNATATAANILVDRLDATPEIVPLSNPHSNLLPRSILSSLSAREYPRNAGLVSLLCELSRNL